MSSRRHIQLELIKFFCMPCPLLCSKMPKRDQSSAGNIRQHHYTCTFGGPSQHLMWRPWYALLLVVIIRRNVSSAFCLTLFLLLKLYFFVCVGPSAASFGHHRSHSPLHHDSHCFKFCAAILSAIRCVLCNKIQLQRASILALCSEFKVTGFDYQLDLLLSMTAEIM